MLATQRLPRCAVVFSVVLSLFFQNGLTAQEFNITRKPGESLQQFAARIIPPGMTLIHQVTEGDFGPSSKNIVVLFSKEKYRPFTGWVLVREGEVYKKYILPEFNLPVSTEIMAVMYANAGQGPEKELLILCKHISGVGRYPGNITPFYTTYVYGWNNGSITYLEEATDRLDPVGSLRTAGQVKNRLKKLGY